MHLYGQRQLQNTRIIIEMPTNCKLSRMQTLSVVKILSLSIGHAFYLNTEMYSLSLLLKSDRCHKNPMTCFHVALWIFIWILQPLDNNQQCYYLCTFTTLWTGTNTIHSRVASTQSLFWLSSKEPSFHLKGRCDKTIPIMATNPWTTIIFIFTIQRFWAPTACFMTLFV